MLFELLHVMRRWPSVAAALSIHGLIVGMVLLMPVPPQPEPDDEPPDTPIPVEWIPRRTVGHSVATGRTPPAKKNFAKQPQPAAEPTPDVPLVADAPPIEQVTTIADAGAGDPDASGGPSGEEGTGSVGDGDGDGDDRAGGPGVPDGVGEGATSSTPMRVTSRVEEPKLVTRVEPEYPALARRARAQGVVVLDCVIDEHGRVEVRGIHQSIPLLDAAAVAAVEQWRYEPARLAGRPQAVFLSVRVAFTLDQ